MPELTLATCSYAEFRAEMGVPIRSTVMYPRFLRGWKPAGHAKLVTPARDMLRLPRAEYSVAYLQHLDRAGVDAVRAELHQLAPAGGATLVLLCFEHLDRCKRTTGEPEWCHRTMFAGWWQARTGQVVQELGATTP